MLTHALPAWLLSVTAQHSTPASLPQPGDLQASCAAAPVPPPLQAKSQQIRAVFARHNLIDDFDSWSDISVWHRIRVVPTIYFYDEGAVVGRALVPVASCKTTVGVHGSCRTPVSVYTAAV